MSLVPLDMIAFIFGYRIS